MHFSVLSEINLAIQVMHLKRRLMVKHTVYHSIQVGLVMWQLSVNLAKVYLSEFYQNT